jgi:hypothetical protein
MRTYSELSRLKTFDERFWYLRISGSVGAETFGFDRYLNQRFYTSSEWFRVRDFVIVRDNACDLGIPGREIGDRICIHHMNPVRVADIQHAMEFLLDPEYLISAAHQTHNAIHYGSDAPLREAPVERSPYDTCPWKR